MKIQFPFKEKYLFRIINIIWLSGVILFVAGGVIGITEPKANNMLFVVVAAVLVTLLHYVFAQRPVMGTFLVLLAAGTMVAIAGMRESYVFLESYWNWIMNTTGWESKWITGYEIIQTIWLVAGCHLICLIQEKEFKIRGSIAVLLFGLLLYYMVKQEDISYFGAGLAISYLLYVLIEWTQRKWKKVRRKSVSLYMLWLFPFVIVYFVLLMNMPVSQEPYDWKFFKDAQKGIEDAFTIISRNLFEKEDEFDFALSNFSGEGEIRNDLFGNERKIMILKSDTKLKTNVYLAGKIFDTFDGEGWHANVESFPNDSYLDAVETLYAVKRYDNKYSVDYLRTVGLEVCYRYLTTEYLFTPLKLHNVTKLGTTVEFLEQDGSLFFDKKQNYGTSYEVDYYQMNADGEFYYDFLEAQKEPDEERLEELLSDLKVRTSIEVTPKDLEEYKEFCQSNYMEEVSLSKGVAEYLAEITKDATTDVEKLKAIEEELLSFTYTKEPGKMPEYVTDGSSFLDYFMLESREGYCTYFATAFVLLARAEGIPARYVQGYGVPMIGKEEVTVTASMAHAWPEAYLDDVGWISFEPTPGYVNMRYTAWKSQKSSANVVSLKKKYFVGEERIKDYLTQEGTILEGSEEEAFYITTARRLEKAFQITGIITLAVIVGFLLLVVAERLRHKYRFNKMDHNAKYHARIKQVFWMLDKLGAKIEEGETLTEFGKRIVGLLSIEEDLHLIGDYEEILYGNKQADTKMHERLEKEQEQILKILWERKRFSYVWHRVWGR